jgi:16S rRNA (cytosine967-C5)-methyltransferase
MHRTASERRVATVPWEALRGLAPSLDAPLAAVLGGKAADRALDKFLRQHRQLTAVERQVVAEAVFGVALWRLRLAHTAGIDASPRALLGTLVRDLGERADAAAWVETTLLPESEPPTPAVRYSFPGWLWKTFEAEAGPEAEALADALNLPGPVCLRANALHTTREQLAERLLSEGVETRPAARAPHGLIVTSPRPNLFGSPAWREGLFEVQDEGSQLLVELLEAQPGEAVLDACAGAGGKSLALAAAVGMKGRVHVADVDLEKLDRLRTRAERARCGNLSFCGAEAPPALRVPRVLVDAPCSELGSLRRGPDLRHRLDPARFAALPSIQLAIASVAASHLQPGGRLVYATCTLRREENEEVVGALLERHPVLRRAGPDLKLWPHRDGTDGFYAAALVATRP